LSCAALVSNRTPSIAHAMDGNLAAIRTRVGGFSLSTQHRTQPASSQLKHDADLRVLLGVLSARKIGLAQGRSGRSCDDEEIPHVMEAWVDGIDRYGVTCDPRRRWC
jgi:hypothetical protein